MILTEKRGNEVSYSFENNVNNFQQIKMEKNCFFTQV